MRRSVATLVAIFTALGLGASQPASGQTDAFAFGVAARANASKAMLWTRAPHAGKVTYRVATDRRLRHVVAKGSATAADASDLTIKPVVKRLDPATDYFYRFAQSGQRSRTGRFTTLPSKRKAAALDLAITGDSDILWADHPDGSAQPMEVLDRVAEDAPALFVYMGDTIYSDSESGAAPALTLAEKWQKYKDNRIAPTQNALAASNTWALWDDHEVINDFDGAELATSDPNLLQAGIDAFNDYWPVIESRYYRKVDFGKNIDLFFLDERSYRSQSADEADSPCRDAEGDLDLAPTMPEEDRAELGLGPADPACIEHVKDPARTMLGAEQLAWFKNALQNSKAKWKLIVNEVNITQLFLIPYDRWEGYEAERNDLLRFIRDEQIENVVFLTTDLHANIGSRVYEDITADGSTPITYEMITGPIQTCTLVCEIEAITFPGAGNFFKGFLRSHGLIDDDCAAADTYGYGVVSADRTAARLKLVWKSQEKAAGGGRVIDDDCGRVTLSAT